MSWDSGPIFTFRFQRARVSSRISTDWTPGTQRPIFRMSLTNAHTRSIGARTSNVAVPSGMSGRGTQRLSNTLQRASEVVHGAAVGFAAGLRLGTSSIRERGRGPPPFCLGGGGWRGLGAHFSGERKEEGKIYHPPPPC